MATEITHIDVPDEWKPVDDYSSHRPLIFHAINTIPHDCFFEFGMGMGSTPLLKNWYTEVNTLGKEYYSFETNKDWAERFITSEYKSTPREWSFVFKNHMIIVPDDYMRYEHHQETIVFIDSAPGEQRMDLIKKHSEAEAIIVHDTEEGALGIYGIRDVLSSFKYRLDYRPAGYPGTSLLSNKHNVENWKFI